MKILYFYQYFSTPKGAWGTRVYEFAKRWTELGHEVIVVTSIYVKSDLKATKFIENQIIDGIKVKVINIKIDNKQKITKRIWTFIQYLFVAGYYALKIKADIVIASSGPISVGIPGLLSRIRNKNFVFEVRDLWPEGAVKLGIIKNRLLIKLSYYFEKLCYKKSKLVIALSPGMLDDIKIRYPDTNVISITNAANINLFSTANNSVELPNFYKNKKVAIYTGNIGAVNNSMLLLETARILKKDEEKKIVILMIGEGQQKKLIQERIIAEKLNNLIVLDLIPKKDLVCYLQNSQVSLVPLESSKIWDTSSPNKLFESLAAGIPVIQTTKGWLKELLSEHNCGFSTSPEDPQELADLLKRITNDEQLLKNMGENAKELAIHDFDKTNLADKMLSSLIKIYNSSKDIR